MEDNAITSFATTEAWGWLLQFCIIAIGLLAGNILRRKVPMLRKSLIPSALLGGALLLCLKAIPGMDNIVDKQSILAYILRIRLNRHTCRKLATGNLWYRCCTGCYRQVTSLQSICMQYIIHEYFRAFA